MLALSRSGRQTEALRAYAVGARRARRRGRASSHRPSCEPWRRRSSARTTPTVRREPEPRRIAAPRQPSHAADVARRSPRLLDAPRARLRRRRLVTLVGPGGVGKTRLAIEAARAVVEAELMDVWLVELADVTDGDGIASAIATALGLPISGDPKMRLARDRRVPRAAGSTLVVLDNCEHLIDAVARVAQDLLELCPTMRILATSRERLGVPGEVLARCRHCRSPMPSPCSWNGALPLRRPWSWPTSATPTGPCGVDLRPPRWPAARHRARGLRGSARCPWPSSPSDSTTASGC